MLPLPRESKPSLNLDRTRSNLDPKQDVSIIRINYEAFGRNVAEDSIRTEVGRDAFPRCTWIMHSDTLQCFEVGHVPFQRILCIATVTERTITTWKRQLQAVLNTDIHAFSNQKLSWSFADSGGARMECAHFIVELIVPIYVLG